MGLVLSDNWKITLPCTRAEADALAEDNLFLASADSVPTIVTREAGKDTPEIWAIDVYCDVEPDAEFLNNISRLAPSAKTGPKVEKLADQDWVTLSQRDLKPLRAGRFYVHASHSAPQNDPKIHNICIDASQAFGTGHHETTLGCLQTLDRLKRRGQNFRNIIDVGTGTGLLAFAANHLWRRAKIIASDIDPVAVSVGRNNAKTNHIKLGGQRGSLHMLASNGLDHPAIRRSGPFDL
ncbi:Ribosomal protein L11 methyltransferase, partial [hydrothermal vent metagenome]